MNNIVTFKFIYWNFVNNKEAQDSFQKFALCSLYYYFILENIKFFILSHRSNESSL